jgi:hypothetical protein
LFDTLVGLVTKCLPMLDEGGVLDIVHKRAAAETVCPLPLRSFSSFPLRN